MATWGYWVNNSTSSATNSSTDGTWFIWTSDIHEPTNTCTSSASSSTWTSWTNESNGYEVSYPNNFENQIEEIPDEGKKKAILALDAKAKEKAELTAQELLKDLLDDDQLKIYRETGRVLVKGRESDYLIRKSRTTIKMIGKGKVVDMCCHLDYKFKKDLPETDNTIAKILAIKHNEKEFNKLANFSYNRTLDEFPRAAIAR